MSIDQQLEIRAYQMLTDERPHSLHALVWAHNTLSIPLGVGIRHLLVALGRAPNALEHRVASRVQGVL